MRKLSRFKYFVLRHVKLSDTTHIRIVLIFRQTFLLIHFFEYLSNQIEIDIMEQITYSSQVPEFISELCRTPLLQRLGKVGMNCGCEYT